MTYSWTLIVIKWHLWPKGTVHTLTQIKPADYNIIVLDNLRHQAL